ncbi:YajQ family cyclic di-GMP-binding protein [bacterium]|nr:YajQ family cyclic di-GMP-binding protein [bacterium]
MSQSSFDIVSKIDGQELKNAVQMAVKEITGRFDFKGLNCEYALEEEKLVILAADDYKRRAMLDILYGKMTKRGISPKALEPKEPEQASKGYLRQELKLLAGIPVDKAKEMVKMIKASGVKVQAQIQDQQVRVTGKDKDDLQKIIALFRENDLGLALQFTNYRTT